MNTVMTGHGKKHLIPDPDPALPSPIPTGRGTRSASNEPFTRFLERSTRVPALSLPGAHPPPCQSSPAVVDLRSAVLDAQAATSSAMEFGVFLVAGHGVSTEELRLTIGEFGGDVGLGDTICWMISSQQIRNHEFPSENIKNLASKLKSIAEQLRDVLIENVGGSSDKKMRSNLHGSECVLSLHRFNHKKSSIERNQLPLNDDVNCLSLYIPFERCQIYVQSEEDHFSFDAGPETLVVTIGKQIEEESAKEFKCISGKMIFVPAPEVRQINDHSFSIELKFFISSSSSRVAEKYSESIISITDQMIVAIVITLLYIFFMFLIS